MTDIRPDSQVRGLDIPAALPVVVAEGAGALFSDSALAASLRLEDLGIGPYPVRYLARYVRAAGRAAAVELPQPLIGEVPASVMHGWLVAAAQGGSPGQAVSAAGDSLEGDSSLEGDDVFARWLEMVAALLELRRRENR